jgi:hypothetical protein
MYERKKFKEAKHFYSKMIEEQEHREIFEYNLSAFLSSARSILLYALREAETKPGGKQWYDNCISSSPILKFFRVERDINIHEEPIQPLAHSKIGSTGTIRPLGSISIIARDKDGNIKQQYSSDKSDPIQKESKAPEFKETKYRFNKWGGSEDVLTLCRMYVQELKNVIKDGLNKGFITV